MANERITENLVREIFRDKQYFEPDNNITIEEQKSEIQRVKKLPPQTQFTLPDLYTGLE